MPADQSSCLGELEGRQRQRSPGPSHNSTVKDSIRNRHTFGSVRAARSPYLLIKNVAILGGFLILFVAGRGRYNIDHRIG
jgi:hypothetical protein